MSSNLTLNTLRFLKDSLQSWCVYNHVCYDSYQPNITSWQVYPRQDWISDVFWSHTGKWRAWNSGLDLKPCRALWQHNNLLLFPADRLTSWLKSSWLSGYLNTCYVLGSLWFPISARCMPIGHLRVPEAALYLSDFVRCRTTEVRTSTGKEPQLNAFSWSSHQVDEQGFCKTFPNLTFSQNQVFIALQWADSWNQNQLKIVGAPLS